MANDEKVRGSNGRSGARAVDTLHSVPPTDEAAPATTTTDTAVPAILDLTPELLGELARAMQNAVNHERERIAAIVSQGGAAHVERVRARAASEAEELRRLAEEDVDRIKDWSTTEIARIREEVSRRTGARRSSLEQYLTHHDAVTQREIESIESAIREYGETLKRFFTDMTRSGDPEEIARRASTLPPMPDLDEIGSAARAAAVSATGEIAVSGDSMAARDLAAGAAPSPWTESIASPEAPETVGGSADATVDMQAETGLIGVMDPADAEGAESTAEMGTLDAADSDQSVGAVATSVTPVEADATAVMDSPGDHEVTAESDRDSQPAESSDESTAASAPTEPHGAAVRLLRSIAPWTAPTNEQGGNDQPD